jgi:hypothetical protein
MSPKSLRHPFIFIKVGISLKKKLVLLKYIRKKLDFLPPKGPSLYTIAPELISR